MTNPACRDEAHLRYERAPIRDLAALIRACVELDQLMDDGMLGDVTEAESQALLRMRYAVRRIQDA